MVWIGKKSAVVVFVLLLCIIAYVFHEFFGTEHHLMEREVELELFRSVSSLFSSVNITERVYGRLKSQTHPHFRLSSEQWAAWNNISCEDKVWCNVPIPSKSLFRFDTPPNDLQRWREAQVIAAAGEPALLRHIIPHFPNYMDFLDGDILFRSTHMNIDYFLGRDGNLSFLTVPPSAHDAAAITDVLPSNRNIPAPYYAQNANRAPVVRTGYAYFDRDGTFFFQGKKTGEVIVNLPRIILAWENVKNNIQTPFIMLSSFNENWGLLSGLFPNRTTNWMPWPSRRAYAGLQQILNHNKTLLFLVNQHRNVTHPKLLTLPRGIPGFLENHRRILWDVMMDEVNTKDLKKNSFVFLASSDWGYRPQIKECIKKKFPVFQPRSQASSDESIKEESYFNGTNGLEIRGYDKHLKGRIDSGMYYSKLIRAKISIAVPGLGYDTFRLWESLTLGVVAVTERGIGLDKTVWRLPVLLVDDFADITPSLLRMAYVEAIYRRNEFEFERLTQSFWWKFISKVSTSRSSSVVYETFPPNAEDENFARPAVYFSCHKTNSCGPNTKRIPKQIC
jgi:hypothetical protein